MTLGLETTSTESLNKEIPLDTSLHTKPISQISNVNKNKMNPIMSQKIVSGHYHGELRGLTSHPSLPIYITCGDDGLLCCWSLTHHILLSYIHLPDKLKAVEIHPDGYEIAVALNSSAVWIIKTKLLLNPKNIPLIEVDHNLSGYEVIISKETLDIAYELLHTSISESPIVDINTKPSNNSSKISPNNVTPSKTPSESASNEIPPYSSPSNSSDSNLDVRFLPPGDDNV